jgi:ribosomal protein S18
MSTMNARKLLHLTTQWKSSIFTKIHGASSLQTVRVFSAKGRPGDRGGNANAPDPSQVDWKEWVASKLPGTGSTVSGASHGFGPRASPSEIQSSFESADDFERRMFGDFSANNSHTDSFFQKLDRIDKARGKAGSGFGKEDWNEKLGWEDDQAGHGADTLADGMDDKLKKAALEYDYGVLRPEEDYSFRPDATFLPGSTYTVKDLDLTKPAVRRPFKRLEFQTTTGEVLRKADFRNVRFLQNFITEAGILYPRKKFGIRAKAQRKIAREIKTARAFGLMPFTSMGKKAFVFGRTVEDLDEDYEFDQYDDRPDDLEDIPVEEVLETEDLDIPDFDLDDLKSK